MSAFMQALERRCHLDGTAETLLLQENFNGAGVNARHWHLPYYSTDGSTFYGRTQQRVSQNASLPKASNGSVHLLFDTYNPTQLPGLPSGYGTELISAKKYSVTTGLHLTVRARLNAPIQGGLVGGLFMYMVKKNGGHDEVDTEILSNPAVRKTNLVQTNLYTNEPLGAGSPQFAALPAGGTLTDFHTYEMFAYPDHTVWSVDGVVVRTEDRGISGPVRIHLNIWAPASDWVEAYNTHIVPTVNRKKNREFSMDVDSVTVSNLNAPPPIIEPGIHITHVPPPGNSGYALGTVGGNLADYSGVAVFIKVRGGWWTKPYWDHPITEINSDGTWSANIVTGGVDSEASEIRAYLVPVGFDIPLAGGGDLDASLESLMFASVSR